MTHCNEVAEKLSGYIDGELTQQQAQQVSVHVEECLSCGQLHSELLSMQAKIKTIKTEGGEEAALEKIMQDPDAQQKQKWGWLLLITGTVMIMGFALIEFILSSELSMFEKFASGFLWIGGLLLFLSVLRQRAIATKTDKYKDINL